MTIKAMLAKGVADSEVARLLEVTAGMVHYHGLAASVQAWYCPTQT